MKPIFIFILAFPFWLSAQTVHLDDKKIEYKDDVKLEGFSKTEIFNRAKTALQSIVQSTVDSSIDEEKKELKAMGVIRLPTSYPIVRNLSYTLKLSVKDDGYHYKIDDVGLWEKQRGGEAHFISSKDIIDRLDEPGKSSIEGEHILNAIDLNLQKILTLIEIKMKG